MIGYDSRIEIEFTKYMINDKLNSNFIIISCNEKIINGTINFINSEVNPNNHKLNYSSIIEFIPNDSFYVGDFVNVTIKKEIECYAGIQMISNFNQLVEIIKEPKILINSDEINVTYGQTDQINFTIAIIDLNYTNKMNLILKTEYENIIKLESDSIEINNNKNIQITAQILLPGTENIILTLEGTRIKKIKKININYPKIKLELVKASIESYSNVLVNSPVYLYISKPNSIIYYTTKESTNINDFQIYTGSIIISNDTIISAFESNEDYENSDFSMFIYNVYHLLTVSFDANGGIVNISSIEVKSKEPFANIPLPFREFYLFDGWFDELEGGKMIKNDTIVTQTENITLYAHWTPKSYTLSFETNGGTLIDSITQPHGTIINIPNDPIKVGFSFIGWFEDKELTKENQIKIMPTHNQTLYAKWSIIQSSRIETIFTTEKETEQYVTQEITLNTITNDEAQNIDSNGKENLTMIIAIIASCVLVVLIAIIVVIVIIIKKKNKYKEMLTNELEESLISH